MLGLTLRDPVRNEDLHQRTIVSMVMKLEKLMIRSTLLNSVSKEKLVSMTLSQPPQIQNNAGIKIQVSVLLLTPNL